MIDVEVNEAYSVNTRNEIIDGTTEAVYVGTNQKQPGELISTNTNVAYHNHSKKTTTEAVYAETNEKQPGELISTNTNVAYHNHSKNITTEAQGEYEFLDNCYEEVSKEEANMSMKENTAYGNNTLYEDQETLDYDYIRQ